MKFPMLKPEEKCACGWYRLGKCPTCDAKPKEREG